MNFKSVYNDYKEYFELELKKSTDNLVGSEENLINSMKYSLLAGGKRIRPVLMLMVADVLCVKKEQVLPFALAIEYIHTYSLIHDDLPAMDNDDLRRGKPTNHVVFGEDMAILAGDALLNKAYEIIFRNIGSIYSINASRILSMYAGLNGMVGGQAYDIKNLLYNQNLETLEKIHENKTGKLITASTVIPSCFAGDLYFSELKTYGEKLGLLFQITDDLLDLSSTEEIMGKGVNKDKDANKLTYVTLLGEESARNYAKKTLDEAIKSIENITSSEVLVELANYVYNRKN
ncbi:MAG: polyprenyl synthetase family protein [Clostridia bacterium]|nr:polyprenyl synthetase family protein [Clostridia bacterium]